MQAKNLPGASKMSTVQNLKMIRICGDMKSHLIDKPELEELRSESELEDLQSVLDKEEDMKAERKALLITAA
jgi:hypothetical protein